MARHPLLDRAGNLQRVLTKRRALVVAGVIFIAFLLRLGFVLHQTGFRPYGDAADYDRVAVSLVLHGGYPPSVHAPSGGPEAFRPPGYPFLLAALYRVTGTTTTSSRFTVARILSAVLSTAIVGAIGLIAWLLWGWGLSVLVTMLCAAIYPPLVTIGAAMLSEPLFTLLVLAGLAATLAARRSQRRVRWSAAVGICVGLAALTRTNGIVVLLPMMAGIWPRPRVARASLAPVAALVGTTILLLAPWAIRNTLAFHRFVPVSTQAGLSLAGTFNDAARTDSREPARWRVPTMPPYRALLQKHDNEAALDQHFFSQVVTYVGAHPTYVAKAGYYNLGRLLDLEGPAIEHDASSETGISTRTSDIDVYAFYILGLLAIFAIMRGALRSAPPFVWSIPVLLALSLIFVIAYMRYRLPIDPFLILLVAGTWRSARAPQASWLHLRFPLLRSRS